MTLGDFEALVSRAKLQNPIWFELDRDPPADDKMIGAAQTALGVSFPQEYIQFLKMFGGGYFAFVNVYSVQPGSAWFVADCSPPWLHDYCFLGVSDNGVGDFYGFRFSNCRCDPRVAFFDHDQRSVQDTPFTDFFEYLAAVGLRQDR